MTTPIDVAQVNPVKRLWRSITEPRHLKIAYMFVYLLSALTGVATLAMPPQSIQGVLGDTLMTVWSLLFLAGGVGGMVTVLPGWWKWERWSITFSLAGLAIYASVITTLHFAQSGSRLTQLGILLIASTPFIIRWVLIRWYSFEPRR